MDLTEAETISLNNDFYKNVLDNLPGAVIIIDEHHKIIMANRSACSLFCRDKDEFFFCSINDIVDHDAIKEALFHKQNDGDYIKSEITCRKKDGSLFLSEVSLSIVNQKNLLLMFNPGMLIKAVPTEKVREPKSKIRVSEKYFKTLIEISPYGIVITDKDGFPGYISGKALEYFRIPHNKNLSDLSIFDFLSPEYLEEAKAKFSNLITGVIFNRKFELKCMRYDGSDFWAEINSSSLKNSSGEISGVMIVCQDITNRKVSDKELIAAIDKADQSDRLKTAMLRNISHEIRTPLNAILGFSDLITDPGISDESKKTFAEIIHSSSDQLLSTINDLIDISVIQARIASKNDNEVALDDILKEIRQKFKTRAKERNIRLNFIDKNNNGSIRLRTDRTRLIQIISNLVKNALKFSGGRDVEIGYDVRESHLEFYVSDKGIGIDPEYHARIFEPFFQVECPDEIRVEGTGMGLALSKAYVEMLGGKIWLKSSPGNGSVFYFTIPLN